MQTEKGGVHIFFGRACAEIPLLTKAEDRKGDTADQTEDTVCVPKHFKKSRIISCFIYQKEPTFENAGTYVVNEHGNHCNLF